MYVCNNTLILYLFYRCCFRKKSRYASYHFYTL